MAQFEICSGNGHWSKFTEFYIEHRNQMIREYKVTHALIDVKNYIKHGRGAILLDEANEVHGIGCFVLGLAENGFANKEIAVLGNCYFTDHYQGNRTFVRGLQILAEQIGDAGKDVKEVRIPTAADNAYTNRLYQKIADKIQTYESADGYGRFHVYATSYDRFAAFCGRFR